MADHDQGTPIRNASLSRRRVLKVAGLGGAGALGLAIAGQAWASASASPQHDHSAGLDSAAAQLHDSMRRLWEDHITWTRLFIVSAVAALPDLDPTAQRLLQNQADIGGAVVPYYGAEAGAKLTELLRAHILIAGELVTAAKVGDAAKIQDASARWYANADEIAAFLGAANPKHWPLDEMKAMMREHLDLTLAEAQARLRAEWAADIASYDRIHSQILGMADMLSSGIVAQFPQRFGGRAAG